VKIINRYVLKEHLGPFVFALSALTSILLLQYIARKFGDLVGKGLSWRVIADFFVLSIPFTMAMTLPMAVLVAVLYAFSRLASENEITALKAGGVSTRSLLKPALAASVILAVFMLWFNDQVLSRANHELATLQLAIVHTKPTFALRPQVINVVKESQLYLRADQILQDETGRMRGITIYDVSDAQRRRSIYADSGTLAFAANKRDLILSLYDGMMLSVPSDKPQELSRIYYRREQYKIRDVANSFQSIDADTASKGEREMTVCEMQAALEARELALVDAYNDSVNAAWRAQNAKGGKAAKPQERPRIKTGGIGALYCTFITKYFGVQSAEAAEPTPPTSPASRVSELSRVSRNSRLSHFSQDTTHRAAKAPNPNDSVYVLIGSILKKMPRSQAPPGAYIPEDANRAAAPAPNAAAPPNAGGATNAAPPPATTPPPAVAPPLNADAAAAAANTATGEMTDAGFRLADARHWRNRYDVEIQKKFSLAAACIVFVLVGAPIALRFPRGGVGLVMGVGFTVFAIYYVGLIGGEALANKNLVSPFWAMWIDNLIFLAIGLLLIWRMGNEATTSRGSTFGEIGDSVRAWFNRRREGAA
jgi:lipopolysaccharide export system permease protein